MNKLDGKSKDIVSENIQNLKELFPEVFSEGKIDFAKLKEELGEFTDKENERYNFTWNGKQEAKRIAQTPSTGTLRPCKEESKNWDTTQNLYIEGDNLEVLKLLQKSYHKKVKMIYIDPPYNTGKDFVYKDNFRDNIKNYMEQTGQIDSDGNRLSTNSDTNGRYHSDWLSMMYPRLKLARNLLKDDGVIFISIDDNEVANLRKLCDEIFGEDNFLSEFIWNTDGNIDNQKKIKKNHEYILAYSKNIETYKSPSVIDPNISKDSKLFKSDILNTIIKNGVKNPISKIMIPKGFPANFENDTILKEAEGYPTKYNDIVVENFKLINEIVIESGWSSKQMLIDFINNDFQPVEDNKGQMSTFYITQPSGAIYVKKVRSSEQSHVLSVLQNFGTTQTMSKTLSKMNINFDYPKPLLLIEYLIQLNDEENSIVLDFFSGSGTTAHSVINLNSKDIKYRKYIMVQLPEEINDEEFPTICEIGKERIRRAGEKIIADNPDKDLSNLDIGFKVYKLDSSNIKEWDSDFDNLETNLLDAVDNIKSDRTSEDLLYEILLKYGLDLTLPIEEKTIEGKTVYNIGHGALVVCLDDNITIEVVEAIAEFIKEQVVYDEEKKKRHARVVFKDKSFADTNVKTNAIQVLKQFDIDEVVSV
ncbi:MAG: site-specific DNA-methyltransferase [Sulfurimonas sp.]|nr:MAG: site-specific DNA-methyltransferase [Sulfurimonas sp.]